jgi:catechol 2,3-dioxygenase-like lactoylglutathione lyase family enzyme
MVMNFDGLIPVIQCQQIDKTLEFYQQALRYIVVTKTETDKGLQWAYIKSDNTYLMLQKVQHLESHLQSNNIILHFYTSDVTAQHQFMAAKGVKVGQLEDTAYHVKQYVIQDPEGNRISIGQSIKNKLL